MAKANDSDRFRITLFENGMHSLKRGIQEYSEYSNHKDAMLLKDATMHLHHGIELLMKEILVRHNSFLIFEDLRDVVKKQKRADESGIDVFSVDPPPRTVSYEEAIERVDTFVKPIELDEGLRRLLKELNRLRNQLEHYAIDADIDEVSALLGTMQDPLLKLLEATLGTVGELREPRVSRVWNKARRFAQNTIDFEKRVIALMSMFRGQKVQGVLFSLEDDIVLPTFNEVETEFTKPSLSTNRMDILGISDSETWAVQVKRSIGLSTIDTFKNSLGIDARPWLVVLDGIPKEMRGMAQRENVLASDAEDIAEIEGVLNKA